MLFFDDGKKLEKAFTQDQFDALVSVLEKREDKAATKEDLRESELRTRLEIEKIRAETEKIRAELIEKTEKIRTELIEKLESNKHEILKWITGMVVAQSAVFIALAGVAVGLVAFYK